MINSFRDNIPKLTDKKRFDISTCYSKTISFNFNVFNMVINYE